MLQVAGCVVYDSVKITPDEVRGSSGKDCSTSDDLYMVNITVG